MINHSFKYTKEFRFGSELFLVNICDCGEKEIEKIYMPLGRHRKGE